MSLYSLFLNSLNFVYLQTKNVFNYNIRQNIKTKTIIQSNKNILTYNGYSTFASSGGVLLCGKYCLVAGLHREVNETDDYLLDRLFEEYGYHKLAPFVKQLGSAVQEDSRLAYNYIVSELPKLKPHTVCRGIDIIANSQERWDLYKNRANDPDKATISTGLKELDEIFGGWDYGDELVTMVARTNQGKSWILLKFLTEAWKQGKRVGLYSGEMSHVKLGYRFDALFNHFSIIENIVICIFKFADINIREIFIYRFINRFAVVLYSFVNFLKFFITTAYHRKHTVIYIVINYIGACSRN